MRKVFSCILVLSFLCAILPVAAAKDATEQKTKTLKFEYEDYVESINGVEVTSVEGAGGGKVVNAYTKSEHKYLIPVSITESGFYDVSYVVNKKTGKYNDCKVNFSLNLESDFPLPFSNENPLGTDLSYTASGGLTFSLFEYKSIWIDKDDYILETSMEKTGDAYYKYQLDYFEFKKTSAPSISQSEVSRIELEQFAGVGVYEWDRGITKNETLSGEKLVFDSWSDIDPSFSFPVKVKDSGFYHVNYVAGDKYELWFSKISYKLGKVLLGTNIDDYIESYGEIVWESQPLCKYRTEWVWLDSGEYDLSVLIEPDEINHVYKYQMDYIEFEPAVNGISMKDGKIKVHAVYTDELNGKVIMAVYNKNKLVGTNSYMLAGEKYIGLEYTPSDTVTNVKVFIWDEENGAKPIQMYKNFDLAN